MALTYAEYHRARQEAQLHVQVELSPISPEIYRINESVEKVNWEFPLTGKIVTIFRGHRFCQVGQTINFHVGVLADDQPPVPSGVWWIGCSNLVNAKYMEVYLNGEPPDCSVALSQYQIIEAPTEEPLFPTSEEVSAEVKPRKMPAKSNSIISDSDKSLLRELRFWGLFLGIVAVGNFIFSKPNTSDPPPRKILPRISQVVSRITAEAKIRSIGKKQQAFYQKNHKFATAYSELELPSDSDNSDYIYAMTLQNSKLLIATARAKKPQLKSYVSFVIANKKSPGISQQFICEIEQYSPTKPLNAGAIASYDQFQCPPGSRLLNREG